MDRSPSPSDTSSPTNVNPTTRAYAETTDGEQIPSPTNQENTSQVEPTQSAYGYQYPQVSSPNYSSSMRPAYYPYGDQNRYPSQSQHPQYPPQPNVPPYYAAPLEEEENGSSAAKTTALLAIGSLLGLTAAATVRWLNGDDFVLLPQSAASSQTSRGFRVVAGESGESQQRASYSNSALDDRVPQMEDDKSSLSSQIDALLEALHSQARSQDQIIAKLNQQEAKQTDESMELLRSRSKSSGSLEGAFALFSKLVEVKSELSTLQQDLVDSKDANSTPSSEDWESRLSATILQLQEVIDRLEVDSSSTRLSPNESAESTYTGVTGSSPETMLSDDALDQSMETGHDVSALRISAAERLVRAIESIMRNNEREAVLIGAQLLFLYVVNLCSHPKVPRYRKIYTSNESFQKVEKLAGGRDFLLAIGFAEKDNCLEWLPTDVREDDGDLEPVYLPLLEEASAALSLMKSPGRVGDDSVLPDAIAAVTLHVASSEGAELKTDDAEDAPPSPPRSTEAEDHAVFKTPESGSIISPPMTKKQAFLPNHGFPPSHPLARLDEAADDEEQDHPSPHGTPSLESS